MALDIKAWVYTTDEAKTYQQGVANYIATQEQPAGTPIIGGTAQTSAQVLDQLPEGFKPRTVTCVNAATGKTRQVVCMSATAPLYTGTVTTINLQDGAGVSAAYVRYKATGERNRRRKPGV